MVMIMKMVLMMSRPARENHFDYDYDYGDGDDEQTCPSRADSVLSEQPSRSGRGSRVAAISS